MSQQDPRAFFDQRAASSYDHQWAKLAPLRDALHLLVAAVFADLPEDARILCVGAGTGAEIVALAERFPGWRFMAVEPSAPMLDVCRRRAEDRAVAARCEFHEGYLDSLPPTAEFDAATSLLVSQFILGHEQRVSFFREIARRLRPGGYLASTDLASDLDSAAYRSLLEVWVRMMAAAAVAPEMLERLRGAYGRDVAVLPPDEVSAIIASAGFDPPVQFYQGGLIHGWYATRSLHLANR